MVHELKKILSFIVRDPDWYKFSAANVKNRYLYELIYSYKLSRIIEIGVV
jgi:hypothetical protein